MAKERGILRKLLKRIFGDVESKPPPPKRPPPSTPSGPRPDKALLRRQALNNILSKLVFAKRDNVLKRLRHMTIDELIWTTRADTIELQTAASQHPDRIDEDQLPLNPWWYK